MQISATKNLSKRVYAISQRAHHQPAARELVMSKRSSRPKVKRRNSQTVFEKNNLEATKNSPFLAKMNIAHKIFPPSSIINCLVIEQLVLVPLSVYSSTYNSTIVTKQEGPKYKPEQTPTYPKDTIKKEINQHLTTSATPLLNKVLESPRINLSFFNTMILDGIETGVVSEDFPRRLKRKNVPIPDIYFILLDAASITPNLVVNSHAKGK